MRMNLTDEEAKLILRQREVQDAYREGWNKAFTRIVEWAESYESNVIGKSDLLNLLQREKRA